MLEIYLRLIMRLIHVNDDIDALFGWQILEIHMINLAYMHNVIMYLCNFY